MKIIDLAICVDNIDPKGIGRIRCVRYSDFVSVKERAMDYSDFDDNDSFIAIPFLPLNINFIPEIGQAVKIITYNAEKDNVNVEYIAGPFTTPHDFNGQLFSSQVSNTTYGVVFKEANNIINPKIDTFINPESEGSLARKNDFGVYGKYGSDIIFTENGLQLRGGKLISKETKNKEKRKKAINEPIMAKKNAALTLKKFPQKLRLTKRTQEDQITEVKDISVIIEYEFTTTAPYSVKFYVYDVLNSDNGQLKTNVFDENIVLNNNSVKLLNIENDDVSPTLNVVVNNVDEISSEIRNFIFDVHEDGLQTISTIFKRERKNGELRHPIYFRPKLSFIKQKLSNDENILRRDVLNQIRIYSLPPSNSLIWSQTDILPPVKIVRKVIDELLVDDNNEQSFSSLKSDRIYLLSTDVNKTNKAVDFSTFDKYELSQENYIKNIEPNTYSTVRGENLLKLMQGIISVLFTHRHNINSPMVTSGYAEYEQLLELLKNMENDILNNSIRIN